MNCRARPRLYRSLLISLCMLLLCPRLMAAAPAAPPANILVLGDSLSAAYGLDVKQGWVSLLDARLAALGYAYRTVNASISGDTSAGGRSRLNAALERSRPALVLIELGANDGLRGQSTARLQENLQAMIASCREAGAQPVLFEMRIPSNYGAAYTEAFAASFSRVASATNTPLVPFFLGAFAGDATAFQADGIHPAAAAQPQMLEAVWAVLQPLLDPPR